MTGTTAHISQLLKTHGLRVTAPRSAVLKAFMGADYALSQPDLESRVAEGADRVTLYRVLQSFLEKGLIHPVPDDGGTSRFALCRHDTQAHVHQDAHVHFKCAACGQTQCLPDVSFPDIAVPEGYRVSSADILVHGQCAPCAGGA